MVSYKALNTMDKLMEIKKLYEAGILTKEEMEAEKAKVLYTPETTDKQDEPVVEETEIAPDAQPLPTDTFGHVIFDEPKESVSETENLSESENSPLQEPKRNNGLALIATIILVIFVGFFLMFLVKNCDSDKTHSADDTYDVVEAVDTDTVDTDEEDDTEIEATETGAWDGRTVIEGGMYRNCYTCAFIDLVSDGNNNYHGTIKIQAGDGLNGCLEGNITANGSDSELTIHIIEPYVTSGNNGNVFDEPEFYKPIQKNSDIFRIIKHGTSYSVQPLGNMSDYFDGIADETIVNKQ